MLKNVERRNFMKNQAKKPITKKWWFWLIIIILICGAFGGIIKSQEKNENGNSSNSTQVQSSNGDESTEAKTEKVTQKTTTEITTEKESKEDYIANCVEVAYKDLARDPDKYKGKNIKVTIEVNQELTGGLFTESGYRGYEDYELDLENANSTYLQKEWYISYEIAEGELRILTNDVVVFYGEYTGTIEMERALTGTTEYVPNLKARYHEIISE